MVTEKFYETPAGRLRATLLLSSGEQYSTFTVQGRYLALHVMQRDLYGYFSSKWMMDRLIDLVMVSGSATMEQGSLKKYEESVSASRDAILDYINPFRKQKKQAEVRSKQDTVRRRELIERITEERPRGFSSLDDIRASLGKIIQNMQGMGTDQ